VGRLEVADGWEGGGGVRYVEVLDDELDGAVFALDEGVVSVRVLLDCADEVPGLAEGALEAFL
jgi:hypothetical protein